MNTGKMSAKLQRAHEQQRHVHLTRTVAQDEHVDGFVVGIGRDLCAVAILSDGIDLDGFEILRLADITKVKADPPESIHVRILRARGRWPISAPDLPLNDVEQLLGELQQRADMVSVYEEEEHPGSLLVGVIAEVSGDAARLDSLNTDAEWDDEPYTFDPSRVTRIAHSSAYMAALALVAPPRPTG